jgi:hypothetical protein
MAAQNLEFQLWPGAITTILQQQKIIVLCSWLPWNVTKCLHNISLSFEDSFIIKISWFLQEI